MTTISYSNFQNFHNEGSGGIINQTNSSISIFCCSFSLCSTMNYGGCFYFIDVNCSLSKLSFFQTYSLAKTDNIFGNIMYIIRENCFITDVSSLLCGTPEFYSDSSLRIDSSKVEIQFYRVFHFSAKSL